jgi:hypothetical protein
LYCRTVNAKANCGQYLYVVKQVKRMHLVKQVKRAPANPCRHVRRANAIKAFVALLALLALLSTNTEYLRIRAGTCDALTPSKRAFVALLALLSVRSLLYSLYYVQILRTCESVQASARANAIKARVRAVPSPSSSGVSICTFALVKQVK